MGGEGGAGGVSDSAEQGQDDRGAAGGGLFDGDVEVLTRTETKGTPAPAATCASAVDSMSVLSAAGKTSRVSATFAAVTKELPASI